MPKITNVHVPAQQKNLAINGSFDFWQDLTSNIRSVSSAAQSSYLSDMFTSNVQGSTTKVYTVQRSADVPSFAQSGFQSTYSILFTNTNAIASPNASDIMQPFHYRMEGVDYQKIHGKVVTYGFWFKASVAGTYNFALFNSAGTRSYLQTFTAGANTWEFKTITVQMDNSGTWNFDNTIGLFVAIGCYAGSTFQTATTGAWQAATNAYYATSSSTNYWATAGATIRVAQFSIVEGPLGFGPTGFSRAGDTMQAELAMCQRYFEKTYDLDVPAGTITDAGRVGFHSATGFSVHNNNTWIFQNFKVVKRTTSVMNSYATATGTQTRFSDSAGTNRILALTEIGLSGFSFKHADPSSTAGFFFHWTADARL